jgi:hypothetical protein
MKMARTKPSTAAGVSALIAHINELIEDEPLEWHFVALRNLARGASKTESIRAA